MSIRINGALFIRASRGSVWAALHDVELLAACLPGCRLVLQSTDRDYAVALGVGALGLAFHGAVRIEASEPPLSYRLTGCGSAGRAGAASGAANITLLEEKGGCRLCYRVEATVDGLLALFGPGVLAGAARALAAAFATRLGARIVRAHAVPA